MSLPKIIILFLFIVATLWISTAVPVSAVFQLEVDFPTISGERLTSTSTLPGVIKYGANAFLLVSALAVIVSLIYGGVTYLNSIGRPDVMGKARKRIISSALGLAIVIVSFLILQIVNPQLAVLKINKVPVETGVLFLDAEAYRVLTNPDPAKPDEAAIRNDIFNPVDEETRIARIQELLNNPDGKPRAAYAVWNSPDLRQYFGEIEVNKDEPFAVSSPFEKDDLRFQYEPLWTDQSDSEEKYNFQNFKLYGLLFLPGADAKVSTYYFKNYNHQPYRISTLRFYLMFALNPNLPADLLERIQKQGYADISNEYVYPDCSLLSGGPCKLEMLDGKFWGGQGTFEKRKSAPLSLQIDYWGKGVYLYSDEFGQTLPFRGSSIIPYLSSYGFNDKTNKIEIKNWDVFYDEAGKIKAEKNSNFLAILHENDYFRGNLRIFFEQMPGPGGSKDYGNLSPNSSDGPVSILENKTIANKAALDIEGNKADEYGKIDQPSSSQVFQMPQTKEDWQEWERQGGCKVKICAQRSNSSNPEYFQDCLMYYFPGRSGENVFPSSPPAQKGGQPGEPLDVTLFKPFSIPEGDTIVYRRGDASGEIGDEVGKVEIHDNIRSMQIEGRCIVVLFENRVHKERNTKCSNEPDKCWENGGPGERSEVFRPGDGEYPNYLDLTPTNIDKNRPKHEIGYCRGGSWPREANKPCASSIAVFPLKIDD